MMRIQRSDGVEFYLGRIKDNRLPGHVKKNSPIYIIIEKLRVAVFSNPRKSHYAYCQALGDEEWFAIRDHNIADKDSQVMKFTITHAGRPFKSRKIETPAKKKPEVIVARRKKNVLHLHSSN
jgi:hypothetical protein